MALIHDLKMSQFEMIDIFDRPAFILLDALSLWLSGCCTPAMPSKSCERRSAMAIHGNRQMTSWLTVCSAVQAIVSLLEDDDFQKLAEAPGAQDIVSQVHSDRAAFTRYLTFLHCL